MLFTKTVNRLNRYGRDSAPGLVILSAPGLVILAAPLLVILSVSEESLSALNTTE